MIDSPKIFKSMRNITLKAKLKGNLSLLPIDCPSLLERRWPQRTHCPKISVEKAYNTADFPRAVCSIATGLDWIGKIVLGLAEN